MKIALLAYYFPPDQSVGSIRPENWARWLSEKHDVIVITPNLTKQSVADGNAPYRVIRPQSILLTALEFLNDIRKKKRKQVQSSLHSVVNTANKSRTGLLTYRMPCLHDLWFFSSYAVLKKINPDVIIATHGPYINLITAWIYVTCNSEKILWVDFRDLWTANHRSLGLRGIRIFEKILEMRVLRSAKVVTSVSENLCKQLISIGADSSHLVYNAPVSAFQGKIRIFNRNIELTFCYVGTVYPGWRDPSHFFKLLRHFVDRQSLSTKQLQIIFASRNAGNFFTLADEFGVREFIDYRGAVSREESLALQQQADILLLLESSAPEARGVLTGKVFEYLMTDKPILLVGPGPDSELYQLLLKHDRLFTLDDLERFLRGEMKTLPKGKPVDYSEISRRQLLAIMDDLSRMTSSQSED